VATVSSVAVGIPVARYPPHRSPRADFPHGALIVDDGPAKRWAFRTPASPWDTRAPPCVGCVLGGGVFSLISGLPSLSSADALPSWFEGFIGSMPLSDSSRTCMRAVRPKPSPAGPDKSGRPRGLPVLVQKVSRRVWGLRLRRAVREARASASRPCCLPPSQGRRRPDCAFSKLHTPPTYTSVYASLCTSRYPAQNSRPSGSLLLSRKALSSSTSDRFIPAHWLPVGPKERHKRSVSLQTKLAVRAEAHQFQTGGIRLSVDENQVGLEMTIAKIAPCA